MRIRTKAVLAFAAVALGVSGVSAAAMAAAPAQVSEAYHIVSMATCLNVS